MHHIALHCTNNSNMFHCSTIKIILPGEAGVKKRNLEGEKKVERSGQICWWPDVGEEGGSKGDSRRGKKTKKGGGGMLKRRRRWKRRRKDLGVAGAGWWERQVHQVATKASHRRHTTIGQSKCNRQMR